MNLMNRKNIATLSLVMATFLNPLGYDILVDAVMCLTGSYWSTMRIFYVSSFLFFILYFKLSGVNPIRELINFIKNIF